MLITDLLCTRMPDALRYVELPCEHVPKKVTRGYAGAAAAWSVVTESFDGDEPSNKF